MALTSLLISKASDHLSEKQIEVWVTLFRTLPEYREYAAVYSPLVIDSLTAADGTIKARQLNALMNLIDELGPGEFKIQGDREGLYYSLPEERMALIREAFSIIFDDIQTLIVPPYLSGSSFIAVAQQRELKSLCGVCRRNYWWSNGVRCCGCL